MTEYDYSPAALEQYLAKQRGIAKWADHTSQQKHHPNPFVPSATARDSDFYNARPTPSELYGPDRPPTPPATAPAGYSSGGGYGYGYGYGSGGGYNNGGGGHSTAAPAYNVLSPTWNGHAWVYQPNPGPGSTITTGTRRRDSGSHHHSRHLGRHKSHRHSSLPSPLTVVPYTAVRDQRPTQYFNYDYVPLSAPVVQPNNAPARPQLIRSGSSRHPRSASGPSIMVSYPQMVQSPPGSPTGYGGGGAPIVILDGAPRRKGSSKLRKATRH